MYNTKAMITGKSNQISDSGQTALVLEYRSHITLSGRKEMPVKESLVAKTLKAEKVKQCGYKK